MEEDYEELVEKRGYKEDAKALLSQLKERESLNQLKRRWLMDLPLSKREQKRVAELLPPNDKILPESFLREDDVHYEYIRTFVEQGYGAHGCKIEHLGFIEDDQILDSLNVINDVLFLLDNMTNTGLYSFVNILTEGLIKFEKTNQCMKKIIKEFLPKVLSDKNDISENKMKLISQLLKDAKVFRGNQIVYSTPLEIYRSEGIKILDGLEDFPSKTLSAMRRKVTCVKGYIPTMKSPKFGWSRGALINTLRKKCKKMLVDLGKRDEPSEALAGALGVAGLTLKLILNRPAAIDFRKFSPEIEALQNDIAKSICLLNDAKRVSLIELEEVQRLLDPNTKLSVRSLRMAVRNLLTEYLFECSDMDKVPKCLLESLGKINNRSQYPRLMKRSSAGIYSSKKEVMEEEIQKEVEYVLIISAQAKQVVLNSLPELDFDQDFTHAYVEDLEKSDFFYVSDDDAETGNHPQNCGSYSHELYNGTDSIGETSPVSTHKTNGYSVGCKESKVLDCQCKLHVDLESIHITELDSDKTDDLVYSAGCKESKVLDCKCGDRKLPYLVPITEEVEKNLSTISSHSLDRNFIKNETESVEIMNYSAATPKIEYSDAPVEQKILFSHQSGTANKYLEMQKACDIMSMVAYRFVGHRLDEFSKMEGLELCEGDRLYLQSDASVPEDFEDFLRISLASKFSRMC